MKHPRIDRRPRGLTSSTYSRAPTFEVGKITAAVPRGSCTFYLLASRALSKLFAQAHSYHYLSILLHDALMQIV